MVVVAMVAAIVVAVAVVKVLVWDALAGVMLRVPTGIGIDVFADVNTSAFAVMSVSEVPVLEGLSR